jgi:CDP-glycerol glycerophosphotransferase
VRLIQAFDLVHQEDPNTRLVILGSGPSRERLEQVIEEHGLTSAVTLAGHQPNPYVIVANADCFVLSSDYEGQPMVLLEALILGRPIVTTSFGSVRGALPDGYGLIVKREVEALAEGMRAFLAGKVPGREFDYVEYNRAATAEFYRATGIETG